MSKWFLSFVFIIPMLLITGVDVNVAKEEKQPRKEKPLVSLYGCAPRAMKAGWRRFETQESWNTFWSQIQEEGIPESFSNCGIVEVNFNNLFIVAGVGKPGELSEYRVDSMKESEDKITLRVEKIHYQTIGFLPNQKKPNWIRRPGWGAFLLPRSKKPVVIELGIQQGLIGDPLVWKRLVELGPGDHKIVPDP